MAGTISLIKGAVKLITSAVTMDPVVALDGLKDVGKGVVFMATGNLIGDIAGEDSPISTLIDNINGTMDL